MVVEAEIFPKILTCLKFPDELVRKHSATVVREICKHTPELAQLVVSNGSVGALVDYIGESQGAAEISMFSRFLFLSIFQTTKERQFIWKTIWLYLDFLNCMKDFKWNPVLLTASRKLSITGNHGTWVHLCIQRDTFLERNRRRRPRSASEMPSRRTGRPHQECDWLDIRTDWPTQFRPRQSSC